MADHHINTGRHSCCYDKHDDEVFPESEASLARQPMQWIEKHPRLCLTQEDL